MGPNFPDNLFDWNEASLGLISQIAGIVERQGLASLWNVLLHLPNFLHRPQCTVLSQSLKRAQIGIWPIILVELRRQSQPIFSLRRR